MKILAVVLLLIPLSDCKVVNDFTEECPDFFPKVENQILSPTKFTGERYKQICQKTKNNGANPGRYKRQPQPNPTQKNKEESRCKQICQTIRDKNGYFFATFYDTENRIPVYSAYKLNCNPEERKTTDRKKPSWLIEPQLDDQNAPDYMGSESLVNYRIRGSNQALNEDYMHSGFHKGHLLPFSYADNQYCAAATFTLTNAAPQVSSFNTGKWKCTERDMAMLLSNHCKQMNVYAVTGVVPGNNYLNERVRIPSHFWAAYCCVDQNEQFIHSGGFIETNEANKESYIDETTVQKLEKNLTDLYKSDFRLFGGKCNGEERIAPVETPPSNTDKKRCKLVGKSRRN